jgi:hypothetical protein
MVPNGHLTFSDSTMSAKETKALMSQLDHAQNQLQEYLQEKAAEYQLPNGLPTPRSSADMGTAHPTYWDPLLSAFGKTDIGMTNHGLSGIIEPSALAHITANNIALHDNYFDPEIKDDDMSLYRSNTGHSTSDTPMTAKSNHSMFLPTSQYRKSATKTHSNNRC